MNTRPLSCWGESVELIATLLAASPPNARGPLGENIARDALLMALARHVENSTSELATLNYKQYGFGIEVSYHALAERCADLLVDHEWLRNKADVPTPDALRFILSKRDVWRARYGLSWDILDSVT